MRREIEQSGTALDSGMVKGLRQARAGWVDSQWSGAPTDVQSGLRLAYNDQLLTFQERHKNLVIRDMSVNGNEFASQYKLITLLSTDQTETSRFIDMAPGTRIVTIIRTMDAGSDGQPHPKLIIKKRVATEQPLDGKRRPGYETFGDTPGATYVANINSKEEANCVPGTAISVDINEVRSDISRTLVEKFGLGGNNLCEVSIAGIARSDLSVQDELLMIADIPISSEQVLKGYQEANSSSELGIEEKFVVIDCSPENIKILLTQVETPFPTEDVSAFIAIGYATELQEHGEERAEAWKAAVELGIERNYARIDAKVRTFYREHPEALNQIPERFWEIGVAPRNPDGYSPFLTPEEQRLKSFEDALVDTGLILETKSGLIPETRRIVDNAYLLDVDGVITDPVTQEVCIPVINKIAGILRRNEPVGINTGRALVRLKPVIDALRENLRDDIALMKNLAIVGEFGGTWATFDAEGEMQEDAIDSITVPPGLQDQVTAIVNERFGSTMRINSTKTSMVTVTKNKTSDLDIFKK